MAGHAHSPDEVHPASYYLKIWFLLTVLLVISILGPELEIRVVTLITAFGIAFVKAYIVAQRFMHLDIEKTYIKYMLGTCLIFMLLFFTAAAPDVLKDEGDNWTKPSYGDDFVKLSHPEGHGDGHGEGGGAHH